MGAGLWIRRTVVRWTALTLSLVSVTFAQGAERGLTRAESEEVFAQNENYAIVVGIDRYENLPALRHARDDAARLTALFREQGYTVFELPNYEASERRILAAIAKAGRLATNEGRHRQGNVVFAFAGHGFRDGRTNYLATGETDPEDLARTALSVSSVREALEASGVRQRVLLIDACRNVPGARSVGDPHQAGFSPDEGAEGVAVLYSTGARQLSFEDPGLGQGVFTHYVAKGLSGEAAGADGLVTFDRLWRYVEGKVKRHVIEAFGEVQVPYVGGERTGEFVLARVESGEVERLDVEPEPTPDVSRLTVRTEPQDAQVGSAELQAGDVQARGWYRGCERGDAANCVDLGYAFKRGENGLGSSDERAVSLFSRGCVRGDERGCSELWPIYQKGEIVPPGLEQSASSYERACEEGNAHACHHTAHNYWNGEGVPVDPERAVSLYERGCEGGKAEACTYLADKYRTGEGGLSADDGRAVSLYERGCEGGDSTGCLYLGLAYEDGKGGVQQDLDRAMSLFERSCDAGSWSGCGELERLNGN